MNYITHGIGGVGAGLLMASVLGSKSPELVQPVMLSGAVIGSLFPDIDHHQSYIARKIPMISVIVSSVFKHQGFLHSPLFLILAGIVTVGISNTMLMGEQQSTANLFLFGFLPGIFSHIVLDTLNIQGIPWLWPSKKRFHILSIRTNSGAEKIFTAVLSACVASFYFL